MAKEGKRVLLIDADPQGDLTASLGWDGDNLDDSLGQLMFQVTIDGKPDLKGAILHHDEGVDLIPSNLDLSSMETQLVNAMSREKVLVLVGIIITITLTKVLAETTSQMIITMICGCFVWGFGSVLRVKIRKAIKELERSENI